MTAGAVTISVYKSARPDSSRWKYRQCLSVQSIIGAVQNLWLKCFMSLVYLSGKVSLPDG